MTTTSRAPRGALLLACVTLAGCGGPTQPVLRGKVTYDGEPMANVLVVVNGPNNVSQGGSSDANGNYEVVNPPLGPVKIQVVEPPERTAKGKQKAGLAKLARPDAGIPYEVKPGAQSFDLKVTSK